VTNCSGWVYCYSTLILASLHWHLVIKLPVYVTRTPQENEPLLIPNQTKMQCSTLRNSIPTLDFTYTRHDNGIRQKRRKRLRNSSMINGTSKN